MRRRQASGSTIHGPKFGKSHASALPLPMSLLHATVTNKNLHEEWDSETSCTCMFVERFDRQAFRVPRPDLRHADAPGHTTLPFLVLAMVRIDPIYGMPMHPDIPLCPFWYLQWSGDIVTLDGETFLDMQVAPHQAEASKPAKQSGMYYEEHEAMDNSASTSNVAEFLGRFENANLSNVYHRSTRRKCLNR